MARRWIHPKSHGLKNGLHAPVQIEGPQSSFNRTLFEGVLENIRQGTRPEIKVQVSEVDSVLRGLLDDVKTHAESLAELERLALTQQALGFVDDETTECPVCGAIWPVGHLHHHLETKLATAKAAEAEQKRISEAAESIAEPLGT